jgi:hypothetical protein
VSKTKALKVIAELIEIGCIKQIIGSREKNERYTIKIQRYKTIFVSNFKMKKTSLILLFSSLLRRKQSNTHNS